MSQKVIIEPSRKIEVIVQTDVLVVGGGPAGFGAAVASARKGMDTLLLERFAFLGGCLTTVKVGIISQQQNFIGGIYEEMMEKMELEGALYQLQENDLWTRTPPVGPNAMYSYDPETLKYVLFTMGEEAGVRMMLHTWFASPVMIDNQPVGVFVETKSGRKAILAKIVIDCTGDAELVFRAGGKCTQQELPMRVTKTMRIGEVKSKEWFGIPQFEGRVRSLFGYSTGPVDGTNVWDLTHAEIESTKHIFQEHKKRKQKPGFENSYLLATGDIIGVRETRQIVGKETLTDDDVIEGRRFANGVVRSNYPVDLHSSYGEEKKQVPFIYPRSGWYEIPYGVMVPESLDNTLVAGRCIGAERKAMSSMRVTPVCIGLGQAAGTAAAWCVQNNKQPREMDGVALRQDLQEQSISFD